MKSISYTTKEHTCLTATLKISLGEAGHIACSTIGNILSDSKLRQWLVVSSMTNQHYHLVELIPVPKRLYVHKNNIDCIF